LSNGFAGKSHIKRSSSYEKVDDFFATTLVVGDDLVIQFDQHRQICLQLPGRMLNILSYLSGRRQDQEVRA